MERELSFLKMKDEIKKSGNLFYQYRACRRDVATIYDIENIRHGVVFARTPLQMNDPFDSIIGFSTEKIYDECIDLVLNQADINLDEILKTVLKSFLKFKIIGKSVGFIAALNKLKKYILTQSAISHVPTNNLSVFVAKNADRLYKKCPADVKNYFNKQSFLIFSVLIKDYKGIEIEEKTIIDILNIEDALKLLEEKVVEVRDEIYLPFLKDFLSKLTISCFSASGWDNHLMWAHYANSYSGICVEYDFEKMNKFIGFVYPVEYSNERPTITLKDLGICKLEKDKNGIFKTDETNMSAIISYLLAKNKCWEYEKEWRIINTCEQPYTPMFIDIPFIKSITLGLNLDDMCKLLIWDVCQKNNVDCYQLVINPCDYNLSREKMTAESFLFDEGKEIEYINLLSAHTVSLVEKMSFNSEKAIDAMENGQFEATSMMNVLSTTLDFLSDAYFLKTSFNRYCKNMNVELSEFMEEPQITTGILQINEFIFKAKESSESIKNSIGDLMLCKKISLNEYHTAQKFISNILEMVEKHCELKWFGEEMITVSLESESKLDDN